MYLTLIQLFNPTPAHIVCVCIVTIYGYHSRDSSNEISQTNETYAMAIMLLPTLLLVFLLLLFLGFTLAFFILLSAPKFSHSS